MNRAIDRIREEFLELTEEAEDLLDVSVVADRSTFVGRYQKWYTRALPIVRRLARDRLDEFELLYDGGGGEADIAWYLRGADSAGAAKVAANRFANQVAILASAASRLDSVLADIRGVLQADIFDNEIDAARELQKTGHLRAAGALAGVVLERHLANVCETHGLRTRKKKPTISDFNDLLKKSEVIDTPTWRWVQRLSDIRNICVHPREREPKPEEVQELTDGADRSTKTVA